MKVLLKSEKRIAMLANINSLVAAQLNKNTLRKTEGGVSLLGLLPNQK